MAGLKDNAIIAVIGELTSSQAETMTKEIMKAKRKCAPNSRGTIASGKRGDIGGLLQNAVQKKLGGRG